MQPTTEISRRYLEDLIAERNDLKQRLHDTRWALDSLINTAIHTTRTLEALMPEQKLPSENPNGESANKESAMVAVESDRAFAQQVADELSTALQRVARYVIDLGESKREAQQSDAVAVSVVDEIFAGVASVQPKSGKILTAPEFTTEQLDWIWAAVIEPAQGMDERHDEEWFTRVSKFFP